MKLIPTIICLFTVLLSGCAVSEQTIGTEISDVEGFNHRLFGEALAEIDSKGLKGLERLALVDFGSPSEEERLKVIDLRTNRVLASSLVAHAKESGFRVPYNFSNAKGSHMSSLGLYLTNETYIGKNGYSLRISGISEGRNTNARGRFIVVHGSKYASYQHIVEHGMLGRSEGCFALPYDKYVQIIDLIKGNSAIYAGK
ncbi:murein L,D-transpeptidase catalytic domain family protein [Vibrio sp. D431a]|uniref:murein L,D-transpeptidase catalytic domain family protein n=1 Tax=Vibrio sp. D431a TaxID=2837388 RepID=UPI0025523D49|nr:murein L,D-transpeptidase catalytic domain family protein [Vibrio sp. D431a]MDK9790079.1 murein L,D-transpeptidase catalytic domain family protein [Vibrio sp. D431a]